MTTEEVFKKLKEPFTTTTPEGKVVPSIKWRVLSKKQGICSPYITADMCRERLNEVLGDENWEVVGFEELHHVKAVQCTIRIKVGDASITRSDVGEPNADQRDARYEGKGMVSDAFKRACAAFGIGAYVKQIPNYTCVMSGNYATTKNKKDPNAPGQKLTTPEQMTSYINAQGTHRFLLLDVWHQLSTEMQDKHKEVFTEIYNALS